MNAPKSAARSVTVILGDDVVSKEMAISTVVQDIRGRFGDITEEHFDSSMETVATFLQRYLSPSLFQETRVFLIRHAQQLLEADFRELKDILDYRVPDAFLIVEGEAPRGRQEKRNQKFEGWLKTYKTRSADAPDRFELREYPKPPDYKVPDWVVSQAADFFQRRMTGRDAQFLMDLAGSDLGSLISELRKLDLHLPEGKPIDRGAIEEICGVSRTAGPEDLAVALARKDLNTAMEVIDNLFASNTGIPPIVSGLFKHFWVLMRIRKWAEAHREEAAVFLNGRQRSAVNEIALRIGVAAGILTAEQSNRVFPAIIKSGIVNQARGFKEHHLRAILDWLYEFDLAVKSGRIEQAPSPVQTLCYKIARVEEITKKK